MTNPPVVAGGLEEQDYVMETISQPHKAGDEDRHGVRMGLLARNLVLPDSILQWWLADLRWREAA